MISSETGPSQLPFQDGEDVLLTHLDSRRRIWVNGLETFSKVHVHDDHTEFRQLDEDGCDLAEARRVEEDYKYRFFRQMGDVAYSGAILYDGDEDWVWNSVAAPHPDTVNRFRQRYLTPLGAHSFSLELQDGDGKDGQFKLQTIMDSLIAKKLPVGTDPGYYAHDMHDHAIGLSAIDRQCMKSLRQLAMFSTDLAPSHSYESRRLALGIASMLDYYSFYKFFAAKFALQDTDPLLGDVLDYSHKFPGKYSDHIQNTLKKNGFTVSDHTVTRSPETVKYYKDAVVVLDPLSTEDE